MKRLTYISALAASTMALVLAGCGAKDNDPGRVYMPDMAYSRAYESYAAHDSTLFTTNPAKRGAQIFYNSMPPAGTMKRGDMMPYNLPNDSIGYKMSASVKNPLDTVKLTKADMDEAARLFNINCAICHGAKGTANGPIADKIGAVANLTLPMYVSMADGTMFHSITYGLRNMGSYSSQLNEHQRWLMVKYIRTLQPNATATVTAAATDTTKKAGN